MKKIFGGIDLTWKKLIIFTVIISVYTALINQVPFLYDTSFRDIAISFECWIFFGVIIIMNSKSNLDSALKCFVFFLISQPLIYLIEVPFLGISIMSYYKNWVMWTIACLPMGYIGYYLKKDKWWGLFIIFPIMLIIGYFITKFSSMVIYAFPRHLLSYLFCIFELFLFPMVLFSDKKVRIIGIIISTIVIAVSSVIGIKNSTYNADIFCSNEEVSFDDTYKAYFEDNKYGNIFIRYEKGIEDYCLGVSFKKAGKTKFILEDENGYKKIFNISIGNNKFDYEEIKD